MIFVRKFFDNFFFLLSILLIISLAVGTIALTVYLLVSGFHDLRDGSYFGVMWKWVCALIITLGVTSAIITANELSEGSK